jgi:methylmalonyl-CoA/ethylmalonyl-CoA epimerase
MKLGRLNHIGIATPSIADSVDFYRDVMGATDITEPFELPDQGVRVCFVDTPTMRLAASAHEGTQIELIEPLNEDSPVAKWLENKPYGGQHHLCFEVPDIEKARTEYEAMGKRILGPTRIGAHGTPIFFVHPKDMQGMLIEIMETPKDNH